MPNKKGTKGRKVTKVHATRSRTGTSANQGPSDTIGSNTATSPASNAPSSNSAASPASSVLTSSSGACIDSQISRNTNHQARSALDHRPVPMSNLGGSIGGNALSIQASTAMALDSDEIPMIPAPPGYLPGHRDWIKVYGKIQKCDYCNGRSKEGVIYMCKPCKIYICKPCAVAEKHNRDPHDPHVLDAHAVSWDGWERGPNRPAQPARPRGRPPKVVDEGRKGPAEVEAATAAATVTNLPGRQAPRPANVTSDTIVVSYHPIVSTAAPAANSLQKRTASPLGSTQLPPSKQAKTGQPEQALPNRLPSIETLLQSLPGEFRTCPQNSNDYFSSKEHIATKKYFSAYHLPLHKGLAGFATSNQGHNHGRLPKDHVPARLPSTPREFSATSSHPRLGANFSSSSQALNQEISGSSSPLQKSLHHDNNNQIGTGPSPSRQDLDFSHLRRTHSSSASQALPQDRTALSSSSNQVSALGRQIGSLALRRHQDHLDYDRTHSPQLLQAPDPSHTDSSASHHRDLGYNNGHTDPLTSRDPVQYQSNHRGLSSTQAARATQVPPPAQYTANNRVTPSTSRQSGDISQNNRVSSLSFYQDNPSNQGSHQEYNSAGRHHPDRRSTAAQNRVLPLPYQWHSPSLATSNQELDHYQRRRHLGSSFTTSQHRTRPFDQRQDGIASSPRRNSEGRQRYSPIRRSSYQGYQSLGQDSSSAPSHHRPGHSHHGSLRQEADHSSRLGQDYFNYPHSPGHYQPEDRADRHYQSSTRHQG